MISRPVTCFFTAALTAAIVFGPLGPAVYGQTKPDLVPKAEQISPDLLEPAVRQAVANGAAALIARITAEDNASGLAFPPVQGRTVTGFKEVKAKRVTRMETIFEQVEQEVMAEIMQSGKGTGRFGKQKIKVSTGKKIGERERSDLVPDPNGTETMKQEIVSFDTPQWPAYLPGLSRMAALCAREGWAEGAPCDRRSRCRPRRTHQWRDRPPRPYVRSRLDGSRLCRAWVPIPRTRSSPAGCFRR